jgi:hypothetical protein
LILVAAILFLAVLDLGGSGLVMNARYAASLGSGEGASRGSTAQVGTSPVSPPSNPR